MIKLKNSWVAISTIDTKLITEPVVKPFAFGQTPLGGTLDRLVSVVEVVLSSVLLMTVLTSRVSLDAFQLPRK